MRCWTTALVLLVGCGSSEAPTSPDPVEVPVEVVAPSTPDEDAIEENEGEEEAQAPSHETHDVIMLVLHEEPLLRSEQRLVSVIEERIHMRGFDIGQRDATEEEAAFVSPQLESPEAEAGGAISREGNQQPMPSSLTNASHIIVVRIPPPRELNDGQLATRGIAGVLVYRQGEQTPYFRSIVDDVSAWRNAEDVWSGWFLSLLRSEAHT